MKRTPILNILWLFLATRLLLLLITYIMYILLTAKNYSTTPVDTVALFTSWNHWDAANYTRIAQYGYQNVYDLAFFPLFPFLIACISQVLGSWSYILVGTILSNMALFGALLIIYHLVSIRISSGDTAKDNAVVNKTLLYLCIFPTAFFFFAPYNESLYLLLAAGTFLALEHEHWWLAGLLGLFAALTRSIGIFLVIPYLYELWIRREHTLAHISTITKSLLPCVLIPLGTGIYALYCWRTFGNPLAFVSVQAHWGRQTSLPWVGILHELGALFWNKPQPFGSANQMTMILNLSATFGFIFLIIAGWRKLPKSYSIWMSTCLMFILLSPAIIKPDVLLSNQRFVLELFPAFITLALLTEKRPRIHYASIFIFTTLLAILSTGFVMNRWIV
jgi:Gpi18-like mannosyltransferase